MSSGSVITIILGVSGIIGLILSSRNLKKSGAKKAEEFNQHLQGINVNTSMLEDGAIDGRTGVKHSWWQRSVGAIKIKDRNINSVSIIGVANQYGINYYIDFLIRCAQLTGRGDNKKTKMKRKKNSALRGTVNDIEWKGDEFLARKLN